jgi:hypothetical protein
MDPNKATFLFLVLAAGAGNAVASRAAAQGEPFPGREFPTVGYPFAIAVGDLNGDGKPDLATLETKSGGPMNDVAATYLCDGAGALVQSSTHGFIGTNIGAIAIGELTGDAFPDLAVANALGDVLLFPGDGMGGFGAPAKWAPMLQPISVAIADLNGDGKNEVLGIAAGPSCVFVMLGLGGGMLKAPTKFHAGVSPIAIAVADMDGDGKLDAVVAGFKSISILLGNGSAGFAPAVTTLMGVDTNALAIGDFNGDGMPDVATANFTNDSVSICLGMGGGALALPTSFAAPTHPSSVAVGDVNGDGRLDAVSAGNGSNDVSVFLGDGAGSLGPAATFVTAIGPKAIALADLSSDGNLDIVTEIFASSGLSVLLGNGAGTFGAAKIVAAPGGVSRGGIIGFEDLNGDGLLDLVMTIHSGFSISLATPGGGYALPQIFGAGLVTAPFVVGDLNGDGVPDLVGRAQVAASAVQVFLGTGGGAFAPNAKYLLAYPGGSVAQISITDVNGDGFPDVVTAGGVVEILLGNGTGALGTAATIPFAGTSNTASFGDLNGDGIVDAVVSGAEPGKLRILLGTGGVTFGPPTFLVPFGQKNDYLTAIADLDGNGTLDLVVASTQTNDIGIYLGSGTGALTGATLLLAHGTPFAIAVGDVNGDGKVDITVSNMGSGDVTVCLGKGSGLFDVRCYGVGGAASDFAIADLEANGTPDIIVAITGIAGKPGLAILTNQASAPVGTATYGTGTPGCVGFLGMSANVAPKIGAAAFALRCTNAPRTSLGLGIIADKASAAGSYLFNLGVLFHVDLNTAIFVASFDMKSDPSGSGFAPLPIPNNPAIVGSQYYAQTFWVEDKANGQTCSHAAFSLVSSVGIALTVQ